jgi:hypothetical protein
MKKIVLICLLLTGTRLVVFAQTVDSTVIQTTKTVIRTNDPAVAPKTDSTYSTPSVHSNASSDTRTGVQLGIRFAPGFSFNTLDANGVYSNVTPNLSAIRLSGGLIADFFFIENYAFSTGLWYTIKRSAFDNLPLGSSSVPGEPTPTGSSEYNLQYLQIPVSLKLFTNEVAPDTRVYFQVGTTLDAKLAEKAKNKSNNILYQASISQDVKVYKPFDVSLLLGAGVEFRMGENTTAFGGITYNRGLINALSGGIKDSGGTTINNNLKSLNNLLSLEVGLKF